MDDPKDRKQMPSTRWSKTRCGPKYSKWTFQETNTDGSEIKNERPEEPEQTSKKTQCGRS